LLRLTAVLSDAFAVEAADPPAAQYRAFGSFAVIAARSSAISQKTIPQSRCGRTA